VTSCGIVSRFRDSSTLTPRPWSWSLPRRREPTPGELPAVVELQLPLVPATGARLRNVAALLLRLPPEPKGKISLDES